MSSEVSANSGADGGDLLQCYNVSCGLKYLEGDNADDVCIYHSGKPYFHDGYKEWTCCKMKSRDFTIFMSFKGCTKGRHNNVKPEEPVKPAAEEQFPEEITSTAASSKVAEEVPYTPPDESLKESIKIVEHPNLASAPPVKSIVICKNCKAQESTLDPTSECHYHRGIQVFHDSLKFWSCCTHKKFTEFEDFQKLPPCAHAASHQLMIKIDYKENWFQTGPTLTIALYGLKGARLAEGKSLVTLTGGRKLSASLVNGQGITIFENEWILKDYVLAEGSKVTLNPSNTQIVLQKANPRLHWPELIEKKPPTTVPEALEQEEEEEDAEFESL